MQDGMKEAKLLTSRFSWVQHYERTATTSQLCAQEREKSVRILYSHLALVSLSVVPRPDGTSLLLVSENVLLLLKGERDLVESVDEAVLSESIDIERVFFSVTSSNDLVGEVDSDLLAGLGIFEEVSDLRLGENDGERTVLVHVVVEAERNIG